MYLDLLVFIVTRLGSAHRAGGKEDRADSK